jgi:hypothetical protein
MSSDCQNGAANCPPLSERSRVFLEGSRYFDFVPSSLAFFVSFFICLHFFNWYGAAAASGQQQKETVVVVVA